MQMKFKYPKNQIPVETYLIEDNIPAYVITRTQANDYILYKIDNTNKLIKVKTSQTPIKLDIYATNKIRKD